MAIEKEQAQAKLRGIMMSALSGKLCLCPLEDGGWLLCHEGVTDEGVAYLAPFAQLVSKSDIEAKLPEGATWVKAPVPTLPPLN